MSDSEALPRPRQVTVAGTMAVVSCVLLVVALFDSMAAVRTPEMRSTVRDFLDRPPGDGLGIGVEEALRIVHGIVLFNGAVAAAATVLAVYTLFRHNGARIGFSVAAGVLLFTAPFSGGVLPIVVAAAATMLWSQPARDWFAGRAPRPAPEVPGPSRERNPDAGPVPGAWSPPRPEQRLDGPGPGRPAPSAYPFGEQPPAIPQTIPVDLDLGRRPTGVTVAAWLTWVFAGLTVLGMGTVLLALVADRSGLVTELRRVPEVARLQASERELVAALWLAGAVLVFWALASMVLAYLAYRRVAWARVALVVSALAAGFAGLAGFPGGLAHAAAAFATAWLLLSRPVAAWFATRAYDGPAGPPTSPPAAPHEEHGKPPSKVW